jgi:hypothetical protein
MLDRTWVPSKFKSPDETKALALVRDTKEEAPVAFV